MEERRFREISEQQFGERGREQAKICADIMSKTGSVLIFLMHFVAVSLSVSHMLQEIAFRCGGMEHHC